MAGLDLSTRALAGSLGEAALVAALAAALLALDRSVQRRGLAATARDLDRLHQHARLLAVLPPRSTAEVSALLGRALARLPGGGYCTAHALLGSRWLRRCGIEDARIQLGARRVGHRHEAHAWVVDATGAPLLSSDPELHTWTPLGQP